MTECAKAATHYTGASTSGTCQKTRQASIAVLFDVGVRAQNSIKSTCWEVLPKYNAKLRLNGADLR